jgi:predicted RNA binding protein YcfA (HicA-like mRNA interferase family)
MPKLPRISGRQAVKVLEKAGWEISRQHGDHVVLIQAGSIYTLSIPLHRTLAPGLLRDQLRKAGLTIEEFVELL